MFDSIWLDIAIGLITIFFVFSLVTSGVRELFAAMLAARSTHLWNQLSMLLDASPTDTRPTNQGARTMGDGHEPSSVINWVGEKASGLLGSIRRRAPEPKELPTDVDEIIRRVASGELRVWEALYAHPFVRQLDLTSASAQLTRLSHIPSEEFARTMLDFFVTAGQTEARTNLDEALVELEAACEAHGTDAQVAAARLRIEALEEHDADLETTLRELKAALHGADEDTLIKMARVESAVNRVASEDVAKISAGAAAMLPENVRHTGLGRIVTQLVNEAAQAAEDQAVRLRGALGGWFDASMGALSRSYRSRTRVWSFVIGLIVVALFNVDTLQISSTLYSNESTRLGLVSLGTQLTDEVDMGSLVGACSADELDVDEDDIQGRIDAQRGCIAETVELVSETGLPIGWELGAPCQDGSDCSGLKLIGDRISRAWDNGLGANLQKLLGLLITGAALAFGAPFWYDVLKRASGLRSKEAKS